MSDKPIMYLCPSCSLVTDQITCPVCNTTTKQMCANDSLGIGCNHDVISSVKVCPLCGAFMCPECGSHDVSVFSRVTGYCSNVGNWAKGKQQEFVDRVRVDL